MSRGCSVWDDVTVPGAVPRGRDSQLSSLSRSATAKVRVRVKLLFRLRLLILGVV